jgi:hypothetical protein
MAGSGKPTDKSYKVLTAKTVQDTKFEQAVTMNWLNVGNLNPLVFKLLNATTAGVFNHVELGALDEEGNQAALAPAGPDSEGPLDLKVAASGRTARFTMTRLVTAHPALKVPKGRVRKFPVSVSANGKYLVLDLKNSTIELVEGSTASETGKATPQVVPPQVATPQTANSQSAAAHTEDEETEVE